MISACNQVPRRKLRIKPFKVVLLPTKTYANYKAQNYIHIKFKKILKKPRFKVFA